MAKTHRLNTRITAELKKRIQEYASLADRSESWVVEAALTRMIGKPEKAK